jgi:caffeoyl-CoA O-methyltransferase
MTFDPKELDHYTHAHSGAEPPHLAELAMETHATSEVAHMLCGHVQGRLLSLLSHLVKPALALEIGTFTGYSALCIAEGLESEGILHTIDIHAPVAAMADRYFRKAGLHDRIHQHIGTALDVIPRIEGRFDLVLIDADKSNYPRYFELVIDRMNPGGLIIADNVLWGGKVLQPDASTDADTRAMVAYADQVNADPRVENVLLPLRDGLLVSRRK